MRPIDIEKSDSLSRYVTIVWVLSPALLAVCGGLLAAHSCTHVDPTKIEEVKEHLQTSPIRITDHNRILHR